MKIIGIDPGWHGAICYLENNIATIEDFRRLINRIDWLDFIQQKMSNINEDDVVVIEKIITKGKAQGIKGLKTSATNYGILLATAYQRTRNIVEVDPSVWKNHYFGRTKTGKADAEHLAIEMYGSEKIFKRGKNVDHNRCESYLIAKYLERTR
jgi:hypothetical protein